MSLHPSYQFFAGSIELICGPMFSGKTEELIRRARRARIARQKIQIFKPAMDDRYHETNVVSHSCHELEATPIGESIDILKRLYDTTRVVAIDEIQFFDSSIVKIVQKLARRGIRVICGGLDQDFRGRPFGPMPQLLCIADSIDKVNAICTVCGSAATKTYRKDVSNEEQVLVGETNLYEARCRIHCDYADEQEEELLAYTVSLPSDEGQAELKL